MKQITLLIFLLSFFNSSTAQSTIKGSVSNQIEPLIWATVSIKNSDMGTLTDEQGTFYLDVKKGDTLSISYTGYEAKEVIIDTQKEINITLENEALDEVIVTAKGIKRERIPLCCFCGLPFNPEEIEDISKSNDEFVKKSKKPSLFPNPSSDGIFNLKMTNSYKDVQVIISNMLGQQIQSRTLQNTQTVISLDISSQRTGIYLINIIADGEQLPTQKAIRR